MKSLLEAALGVFLIKLLKSDSISLYINTCSVYKYHLENIFFAF